MNIKNRIALYLWVACISFLACGELWGQASDNRSPYSRYGYGSLTSGNTAGSRSLGGLSAGLRDGMITNPGNPASYTAVDSMTFIFDLGVSARYAFLSEGKQSDKRLLGNLEYITVIYPLSRRMAMSAGIMPLFSTGYSFGGQASIGGDSNQDKFLRSYSGDGSYNQLYVGLAGRTFGGLHLGVNGAFVFGHTQHQRGVRYYNEGALNRIVNYNLHLRGFRYDLGLQYELRLDTASLRSLTLGATFSPGYSFRNELTYTRYQQINNSSERSDLLIERSRGTYTVPNQYSVGLTYRKRNHYMVGADFKYSEWTKAKFTDLLAEMQDAWRVSLGAEWTPNYRARGLWQRTKYRLGLSLGNSYLKVPYGNSLERAGYHEYGASLGLALPLVDRRSALNFSIDYKWLRPQQSGMINEHYIGATIGVVFNDNWFRKARVN